MNIYFTFDYEIFFGKKKGSALTSLINPTNKLLDIFRKYQIKTTFFIDAGHIIKLKEFKHNNIILETEYKLITSQIKKIAKEDHSIGLHVHPHWEDSYFNGKWNFDLNKYKLSSFTKEDIESIIYNYKKILEKISNKKVSVYRAGGHSIQPFIKIKKALLINNIIFDSSVFPKGYYSSKFQVYDFNNAPLNITKWKFEDEPTRINSKGSFTEFPISSILVSPLFFWKKLFIKIFKLKDFEQYGDGIPVRPSINQIFRMLFAKTFSVVSLDGYKASLLDKALDEYSKLDERKINFIITGHPKAISNYSIRKLEKFLAKNNQKHDFKTL